MKPIIKLKLENRTITLDYQEILVDQSADPIWSDGIFDGSYIPNPPEGKIILKGGSQIAFSNFEYVADNEIVIKPPYIIDGVEVSIIP